jgi:leader peptidase (prepilin peptidase) / N-methyltransferase
VNPLLIPVFFLGASIGSFLNVCVSRWPADQSVVKPRSRCPRCGAAIAWYDNIPVLSWLALRARCRGCALPISAQYPLVELAVGALFVTTYVAFGPTFTMLRVAIGITILLGIALTDLQHYVIPDGFTVTGFLFAMVAPLVALALGDAGPFAGPWDALIGACVGAGIIAIVGWLGEVAVGKEAMGQGDITLMAFVGAMVGPGRALLTVFVAALLGTIVFVLVVLPIGTIRARRRGEAFELPLVPFGVFLAPAGALTLLCGYPMIDWYLGTITG